MAEIVIGDSPNRTKRIPYDDWNEFINDGNKRSINIKPSSLTFNLKFLDKMLKEGKINRIKHHALTRKLKQDYNKYY